MLRCSITEAMSSITRRCTPMEQFLKNVDAAGQGIIAGSEGEAQIGQAIGAAVVRLYRAAALGLAARGRGQDGVCIRDVKPLTVMG